MRVITPPEPIIFNQEDGMSIFLAGSIEMGLAENWQEKVINGLTKTNVVILNPRRPDWDNAWEQKITNDNFRGQVEWELEGIENVSEILMYFDPNTKSPITLLELGLIAGLEHEMTVICPEGFWRKGNVDIVCQRYNIRQMNSIDNWLDDLLKDLE